MREVETSEICGFYQDKGIFTGQIKNKLDEEMVMTKSGRIMVPFSPLNPPQAQLFNNFASLMKLERRGGNHSVSDIVPLYCHESGEH